MNDFQRLEEMQQSENTQLIDENCITVKNIPEIVTKGDIYNFFKGYGYIKTIYFPKVAKGTMKYCFVEFKDQKSVEVACKVSRVEIKKHIVVVFRKKTSKRKY
ncbi:Protein PES4 [Dictyocoela muelleri]|nr:Protein PES4 [Dictyocoela muelleri]